MTPVFCCGFECGVSHSTAHWLLANGASFDTASKRNGARCLKIVNTGATQNKADSVAMSTSDIWVIRAYIKFDSLPGQDGRLISVNGTGIAGAVFKASDSKIYAGYETTGLTFGATGVSVTTGVWYRLDIKVNISANPWTIDVKVDGTDCGQLTRAVAASTATQINIGNVTTFSSGTYYIDDVIASNTEIDYPFGGGYVNHFIPTSDGTHNIAGTGDFQRTVTGTDILNATTTAFQLVDDVPLESGAISLGTQDFINMVAPPNATDYVECIFGPAAGISTPTVAPRTVEIIAAIAQAGTGNGNMEIRLNDNGTTGVIYTATGVAGVTTIAFKRAHFLDPPSAATQWTLSGNGNFNNLRFRFGSPAAVDANPDQYLVSIMAEAEFAPLVAAIPNKIHQCNQAINRASTY